MSERNILTTVKANIELLILEHKNKCSAIKYVVLFGLGEK